MSSHLEVDDHPLDYPIHLLVLRGRLDCTTVPGLAGTLTSALPEQKRGVIVDLTEVTSLDSSGLALLRDSQLRLARRNGRLAVVTEPLCSSQLSTLIATDATLDVFRTRTEAIAAVRRGVWTVQLSALAPCSTFRQAPR
jgi:anti-anti-sigma factor